MFSGHVNNFNSSEEFSLGSVSSLKSPSAVFMAHLSSILTYKHSLEFLRKSNPLPLQPLQNEAKIVLSRLRLGVRWVDFWSILKISKF